MIINQHVFIPVVIPRDDPEAGVDGLEIPVDGALRSTNLPSALTCS